MDLAMLLYLLLLTCMVLRDRFLPADLPDLYEVMHH